MRPLSFNSHDVGEEDNYFLDMDAPPHHHHHTTQVSFHLQPDTQHRLASQGQRHTEAGVITVQGLESEV